MSDQSGGRRGRRSRSDGGSKQGANGVAGHEVRCGRDLDEVIATAGRGDVVVIDQLDLEPAHARALIAADVYAVVNASTSLSGRYPAASPLLLVRSGIVVIDEAGRGVQALHDGERVHVDGARLRRGDRVLAEGRRRTEADVAEEVAAIRASTGPMLRTEALVADTIGLLRETPHAIDSAAAEPALVRAIDARPSLVVAASWPPEHTDLVRRCGGAATWAVIAAGEAAGTALHAVGVTPDAVMIAPGSPLRVAADHIGPPRVHAVMPGHDLDAAVLSTLLAGAPTLVPIGRVSEDLADVLDQPRGGAAVTGLARLVGAGRIVDVAAVEALAPASLAHAARGPRRRSDQVQRNRRAMIAGVAAVAVAVGALLGLGPLHALLSDGGAADRAAAAAAQAQAAADQQARAEAEAIVERAQGALVANQLSGRRIAVVVAPGVAPAVATGLREVIDQAGGTVSGTVTLTPAYLDENKATSQDDVALRLAPSEASLPASGSAGTRRDAALASSLVVSGDQVGNESEAAAGFIEAMTQVGALTVEGTPEIRAQLALVIVPTGTADLPAVRGLVGALGSAGGAVALSPAPADTSATLVQIRSEPPARVSTSASAAVPSGRILAVDALADAAAGQFGAYGLGALATPTTAPPTTSAPTDAGATAAP